ncbi:hypothetical protein OESDEN_12270 [Oesophagostomum dentatum]|uniref:Uncharacterized protein n=1 Tax=Oesophagostomum dentatum TaxID=61180 RepID=A0A0B1SXK8_OESDE|nr:hypothetical protein OESDEN_12270 [Oesophagostomum dentatum]
MPLLACLTETSRCALTLIALLIKTPENHSRAFVGYGFAFLSAMECYGCYIIGIPNNATRLLRNHQQSCGRKQTSR